MVFKLGTVSFAGSSSNTTEDITQVLFRSWVVLSMTYPFKLHSRWLLVKLHHQLQVWLERLQRRILPPEQLIHINIYSVDGSSDPRYRHGVNAMSQKLGGQSVSCFCLETRALGTSEMRSFAAWTRAEEGGIPKVSSDVQALCVRINGFEAWIFKTFPNDGISSHTSKT